jgi:hypothetical protein
MLSVTPAITARGVLRLPMEETATRCGGRGQPTRNDPPKSGV